MTNTDALIGIVAGVGLGYLLLLLMGHITGVQDDQDFKKAVTFSISFVSGIMVLLFIIAIAIGVPW